MSNKETVEEIWKQLWAVSVIKDELEMKRFREYRRRKALGEDVKYPLPFDEEFEQKIFDELSEEEKALL